MAIEVFNRYENKYLLSEACFDKLTRRLSDYMEADGYNASGSAYTISNLYYDTADNYLVRTSLEKPKYKEKLRLRAYGAPQSDTEVYVEIKKKVEGLVNKRRSAMKLFEAYAFLQTGEIPDLEEYMNGQVLRETAYLLQTRRLAPALYLAYDRFAYFGIGQHDLRVSFDTNIRTRRFDLALEKGDYGTRLLQEGQWLMEIKAARSIPLWLGRLLSENRIYPTSFSKYGAEYKSTLESKAPRLGYDVADHAPVLSYAAARA